MHEIRLTEAAHDGWQKTYLLDLPTTADFFYRGRSQLTLVEQGPCLQNVVSFDGEFTSQEFLILGDMASSRYILIGAVTAMRSFTELSAHRRQGRFTSVTVHQRDIAPDGEPEEMLVLEGDDWRDLLVRYADTAASRAGVQPPSVSANLTGYTSWYYSFNRITESECLTALTALARHRDEVPIRYGQIDDGYQTHHGDWLDRNAAWPSSLAETAARIRDLGFEPGIWLMPFLASTSSKVFQNHRDWFVRRTPDEPWVIRGWSPAPDEDWACLDLTRPDVQAHLREILSAMRSFGYTLFKLDGTGFSAPPGLRQDAAATGVSAYRTGLKLVRETLADCHLFGCSPNLATLGFVDQCRVGTDTTPRWIAWGNPLIESPSEDRSEPVDLSIPCLRNALLGALTQWWQVDRWYRADPDVVLARDEKSLLTEGEARMSALAAIVMGVAFTSDRLDLMSPARRALLARAVGLRLLDPRPIDWREHRWPQAFAGRLPDGRRAVAAFNFGDEPRIYQMADLGLPARTQELLRPAGAVEDRFTLEPHDAVLLAEEKTLGDDL